MKRINQADLKAMISERLTHPEEYCHKPLFIWKALWNDGIQSELFTSSFMGYNGNCERDKRKYFRKILVCEGKDNRKEHKLKDDRGGAVVGFIVTPHNIEPEKYAEEVSRLLTINAGHKPMIVYVPYQLQKEMLPAGEHCLFAPDFEMWASQWRNPVVPDFIRIGNDLMYKWYNYFNNAEEGCSTPREWLHASCTLCLAARIRRVNNICELPDETIRQSFPATMSQDIVKGFVSYLRHSKPLNISSGS